MEENLIGDAAMSDAGVYNMHRFAVEHVGKKEWRKKGKSDPLPPSRVPLCSARETTMDNDVSPLNTRPRHG